MNHQANVRIGGAGVTDNIAAGVVKPSPIVMSSATEEDMMSVLLQERQNSYRAPQANPPHQINEQHLQIQQPGLMSNQNGPPVSRLDQTITQPYQHLSHPTPRAPNNFATGPPPHDQGNLDILHLIYQAPLTMDLLKIPEAVSLQAALSSGQVAPGVLLHQVLYS